MPDGVQCVENRRHTHTHMLGIQRQDIGLSAHRIAYRAAVAVAAMAVVVVISYQRIVVDYFDSNTLKKCACVQSFILFHSFIHLTAYTNTNTNSIQLSHLFCADFCLLSLHVCVCVCSFQLD